MNIENRNEIINKINEDPNNLRFVLDKDMDEDICLMAINKDPSVVRFIDKKKLTKNILNTVVDLDPDSLKYVDKNKITKDVSMKIVDNCCMYLKYIPTEFIMCDKDVLDKLKIYKLKPNAADIYDKIMKVISTIILILVYMSK